MSHWNAGVMNAIVVDGDLIFIARRYVSMLYAAALSVSLSVRLSRIEFCHNS